MTSIEDDPVYREASEWFLRLQGPELSAQETIDWQAWLKRHPRHAQAFEVVERVWQEFEHVPAPRAVPPDDVRRDDYDGHGPISAWRRRKRSKTVDPDMRAANWATRTAIAAALSVAVVGAFVYAWYTHRTQTLVIETARGESRSSTLADGSVVQIGGRSRIEVRFDSNLRAVRLVSGEAYFTAAKEAARPFQVRVNDTALTVLGTEFNVVRNSDRVVVSVASGRVAVGPSYPDASKPSAQVEMLEAGEHLTVDAEGIGHPGRGSGSGFAAEWRRGRLAFESEPLRYVIEDVNRYAEKPIVLADASMGDLRITGTLDQENIRGWVSSLEAVFGIHADERADEVLLHRE